MAGRWAMPQFDWAHLKARRDAEVARLEGIYRSNLQASGVQIFDDRATLVDRNTVALASGAQLQGAHILIATGAQPYVGYCLPGP